MYPSVPVAMLGPNPTVYIPMDKDVRQHLIISVFGMAIALGVIAFRIFVRFHVAGLGWDDYLVVAGYVYLPILDFQPVLVTLI